MGGQPVRDITTFVSLSLVLSLPPFLLLYRELSAEVVNFAVVAALGTVLFFVSDGVGKYISEP